MQTDSVNKFTGMILAQLATAEEKHPQFCDYMTLPEKNYSEEERRYKAMNGALSTGEPKEYSGDMILQEEIAEALNAYQEGDKEHCLQELAQCGAVVIRMMEFVEKEMQ